MICVLHNVADVTHSQQRPSNYIKFSYSRPSKKLKMSEMLCIPSSKPNGLQPCTLSFWLCINKYPLSAHFHILTIFTGEVYVQLWSCACTGDIVIK